MSKALDAELAEAVLGLAALARESAGPAGREPVTAADIAEIRAGSAKWDALASNESTAELSVADRRVTGTDGTTVRVRTYRPTGAVPTAVVVYLHGGGLISGSVEVTDPLCRQYAAESGAVFVSVGYRLAPEHPYPAALDDGYAALEWADAHRAELASSDAVLAVAGDSAGGGLAAGLALLARDRGGPRLAAQILIHPMLDDRTTAGTDSAAATLLTWTPQLNALGWRAVLGDAAGTDRVPAYAAPARATDLGGLPPTYLEVGDLDLFLAENLAYAGALTAAAVPLELHVHRGLPHGGEFLVPDAAVARRVHTDRIRVLAALGR